MRYMNRRGLLLSGGALAPIAFGRISLAQETTQAKSATLLRATDPSLAMQLLIAGRKQIAVCELAKPKLTDEGAKQFAQAEIDEHVALKAKLNELGFDYRVAEDERDRSVDKIPQAEFMVGGTALPAEMSGPLTINHEVKAQCIATQKAEMEKLTGKDFDRRFIENQLDAHYDLFDHGVIFRKHASAKLAPPLDEARVIIEKHIATCKELCKKLA